MMMEETELKVLSLNCWGIPYVSKNRADRMKAIASELCNGNYDVVCLQEIWSIDDYKMIKALTQEKLPHTHYFYSGVVGSGVCIYSRFQIQDVMFHKWSLNGYFHKIQHGDWFGGKGVGLCRLKVNGANVNIYVAHLHAEYSTDHDEYAAHRVLQAFDTAQFIRMTERGADAVILGGDLNAGPQDIAYKIICGVAGLADACPLQSSEIGTNECANNSYTSSKVARTFPQGKRIDHILYLGSKNVKVKVTNFEQPFPQRVPEKNFSYSDHEAIAAHIKLIRGEYEVSEFDARESLKEALVICDEFMKIVRRQRRWYLLFCFLLVVPLVSSLGFDAYFDLSIGATIGINIARLLGTAILCYALFLSTIWTCDEQNSLKAGYLAMEIHLSQLNNNIAYLAAEIIDTNTRPQLPLVGPAQIIERMSRI